jgi:hypothetical protein
VPVWDAQAWPKCSRSAAQYTRAGPPARDWRIVFGIMACARCSITLFSLPLWPEPDPAVRPRRRSGRGQQGKPGDSYCARLLVVVVTIAGLAG